MTKKFLFLTSLFAFSIGFCANIHNMNNHLKKQHLKHVQDLDQCFSDIDDMYDQGESVTDTHGNQVAQIIENPGAYGNTCVTDALWKNAVQYTFDNPDICTWTSGNWRNTLSC